MLNYENALICEKVFLKKAVAETSTKMVVLFLTFEMTSWG